MAFFKGMNANGPQSEQSQRRVALKAILSEYYWPSIFIYEVDYITLDLVKTDASADVTPYHVYSIPSTPAVSHQFADLSKTADFWRVDARWLIRNLQYSSYDETYSEDIFTNAKTTNDERSR